CRRRRARGTGRLGATRKAHGTGGRERRRGLGANAVTRTKTAEVLAAVRELEDFFRRHRVNHLSLMADQRRRVEKISAPILPESEQRRIVDLFGGMGTLNDVVVSRQNGHDVDDEQGANEQLDQMTTRLWSLVS